jgi:predicted patatin/cPLA2 family phospholipase
MKRGLVLEGGAMRGMYTAGVLDVLIEHDVYFDLVAGVSAGALFGVNYVSRQKGRVIRYNKRFNKDPNYMGLVPLLKEGNIISTPYAYEKVPRELDPFDNAAFKASPTEFYAVITDIETGRPSYRKVSDVMEQMDILRASGSLPFVSKPVVLEGKEYMDGGISDSIPFEWAARMGCKKIVVVLTRDESYRKKPLSKGMVRLLGKGHEGLQKGLLQRHAKYNGAVDLLKKRVKEKKAFVIQPSRPIEIAKLEKDPKKLQKVYELGYSDMQRLLPDLLKYLKEENTAE